MPNSVKTRKVIAALHHLGFKEIRQKDSYLFFEHCDGRTIIVPLHKEIKIKLLTKIIKQDLKIKKEKFLQSIK